MTAELALARCSPGVGTVTMAAIVRYESGGRPYAIRDNTTRRVRYPASYATAVAVADALIARGDDIDVGYAQINVSNFASYGLDAASALEPCRNVAVAARILRDDYRRAAARFGPGPRALARALSAYNTGSMTAGAPYARGVWREALRLRRHAFAP